MAPLSSSDAAPAASLPRRTIRRVWLLRGLSILCGLSLFLIAELVCCLLGVGERRLEGDPFVGFSNLQPLFEKNSDGDRFVTAKSRLKFFRPEEFVASKTVGTKRIFCLGGSTVQGRPFAKETSFTTWLELALEQAQPHQKWEVINCGGISYASYRLVPILQECLGYQPDAFIICTGHNEFLEDRSYGQLRATSPLITGAFHSLSRFRSFRLLRQVLLSDSATEEDGRDVLGSDVDAFLDYKDGIAAYHRDDDWRRGVIAHFESNLERMVQLAKQHGVPIVVVRPPSNLADTMPFKSEHRSDLTDQERDLWNDTVQRARASLKKFPAAAVTTFEEAIRIDPEYAATHFELGRLQEVLGNFPAAREEFLLARENDICPLRILTPMERAIAQVAARNDVPLLDAHQLLELETRHGILDSSILVDHVHPSFGGHQSIAMALVESLQELSMVKPRPNWQPLARAAFQTSFKQLPDVYFAKGEQRLTNLRYWTQGMADGPPVESRPKQKAMSVESRVEQ
jgi:lysophospholipase L1-like esterase